GFFSSVGFDPEVQPGTTAKHKTASASRFIECPSVEKLFATAAIRSHSTKSIMSANLEQLSSAITRATDGMAPEDFLRHPQGKWCAAEILEHLNLTYIGTAKNLERCLVSGRRLATSDRSTKHWQRLAVIRLRWFPKGRKSPERVVPRGLPAE